MLNFTGGGGMDIRIFDYYKYSERPTQQDYAMHIHNDNYEILCFMSGSACYYVEGTRYPLERGDLMLMRKGEAHYLYLNTLAPYERYLVNFNITGLEEIDPDGKLLEAFRNRPLGQFNRYPATMFPDNHWQFYLNKITSAQSSCDKLYYLLPLLREMSDAFAVLKTADTTTGNDKCAAIVTYINQHLQEDLSLSRLAKHFYVSRTHLNRIFQQATGSTVWNYITVKRLFMARREIHRGAKPTKVYARWGFQDYNTFYRAYRQHFGVSPKHDVEYIEPIQEQP